MGESESLLAHGRNLEEIRRHLGADTLGYLSLDGLLRAAGERNRCLGCLTGRYPVPVDTALAKDALEADSGALNAVKLSTAAG
jgi:amidophosphoribosyltransferase